MEIEKQKEISKPIVLSFFSGAMGLDLGLELAGFDVRCCCENDKSAKETIKKNRPDLVLFDDISGLEAGDVLEKTGVKSEDVFLIAGGPPCQAFSTAGKRRSFTDARGNVFLKYIELATEIRPPYILIENVRGLLSASLQPKPSGGKPRCLEEVEGGALWYVLEFLEERGYSVSFNLYNTANFGVPQCRERVILLASREKGEVPYLAPTHASAADLQKKHGLLPWRTFRDAVQGLGQEEESVHHVNFSDKHLVYYRQLGPGQNWRDLPKKLQQKALGNAFESGGGRTGFYRRLAWDQPSPTLMTSPSMPATALAHPECHRPLSIEEYKRIQCFPDEWMLCGSLQDQYKQIGNAVPVKFGEAVGLTILRHWRGEKLGHIKDFPYSRYANTADASWRSKTRAIRASHGANDAVPLKGTLFSFFKKVAKPETVGEPADSLDEKAILPEGVKRPRKKVKYEEAEIDEDVDDDY